MFHVGLTFLFNCLFYLTSQIVLIVIFITMVRDRSIAANVDELYALETMSPRPKPEPISLRKMKSQVHNYSHFCFDCIQKRRLQIKLNVIFSWIEQRQSNWLNSSFFSLWKAPRHYLNDISSENLGFYCSLFACYLSYTSLYSSVDILRILHQNARILCLSLM